MRKLLLAWVLAFTACDSPSALDDRWADPEDITYAGELQVDLASMTKNDSGLYWKDLQPGAGDTAEVGGEVRLHFTAWLPDGTLAQTTRTEGQGPIQFRLGYGFVVWAFDEGVVGMRVGGVRQLVAPPELVFGRQGRPEVGIPPLTTIVFEIERLTTIAHTP